MTRQALGVGAAVALSQLAVACYGQPVDRSDWWKYDDDRNRHAARGVFFDREIEDSLNAAEGDEKDWKYVIIPESGVLSLSIVFDDHDLRATVSIYDPQGRPEQTFEYYSAYEYGHTGSLQVTPGVYYLKIEAENDVRSLYSVRVEFEPDGP